MVTSKPDKQPDKLLQPPRCVHRGAERGVAHVYLNGSPICVCTHGPDLRKLRMR